LFLAAREWRRVVRGYNTFHLTNGVSRQSSQKRKVGFQIYCSHLQKGED